MSDLFDLTALSRDTDPQRLRYLYEQHVAAAARAQDHTRLLALSRAYDALPRPIQRAMYPVMTTAPTTIPAPARAASTPSVSRQAPSRRCWPQPMTRHPLLASLLVASVLGGLLFAGRTHLLTRPAETRDAAVATQPRIDSAAIQVALDRANDRDDITCTPGQPEQPALLDCAASDGAGWTLSVVSPPAGYTVTSTRPSVYRQSARFDLQAMIYSVRQCRRVGGRLPGGVNDRSGQVRLRCGGRVSTTYLRPGDRVDYQRLGHDRFTIAVTAGNGEVASYSSGTGKVTS